jgi:hypothetical protein
LPQQHHPYRGHTIGIHRGQCDGVRIIDFGCNRLIKPGLEQFKGVGASAYFHLRLSLILGRYPFYADQLTLHFTAAAHAIVAFCLLLTWDVGGYSATCHAGIFCTAVRLLAQHCKLLYLPGNSAALAIGILHDQVYVEHGQKAAA